MKPQSKIMVKKFGGTSVGSIERVEAVAQRVIEDQAKGEKPVVVVSAMSGETNRLVRLAHDIDPNYRGMAYDMLLASGEQVSISLLTMALERRGVSARPLLAYQLGIETDSTHSMARIRKIKIEKIEELLDQGIVPVVAGFQGVNEEDFITTLGRGGSDTSAVALSAALGAEECEIFTDVPAVFTADPRLVSEARELSWLSYDDMMEMASLGSRVLHFRCVELAAKYGVKIHVRSTFEKRAGTLVVSEEEFMKYLNHESMEMPVVSAVTHQDSMAIAKVFPLPEGKGFLSDLFFGLSEKGMVIDIISHSLSESGQRLTFSVEESEIVGAKEILQSFGLGVDQVEVQGGFAKVSVVGVGMRNHSGVAARFFKALHQCDVHIELVTTSDIKISAVVEQSNLQKAAQALHSEFGLDKTMA